ncbi:MAG: class I SAM-dependent methyltransferase [Gemmatimonadetes bacterium]|nr:class I SAM-dependent methyltransferase [Gemmatimonadota bacterium]
MMHAEEVARRERFEFGKNWQRFLALLSEERIREAERSLREMLGVETLEGLRFLDVGSGSGLFSLAARRLGASVHSFDYDPYSVACTRELRRRCFPDDPGWIVEEGSILDARYVSSLGTFDVVYSWGVLHHTGDMWRALENVGPLVAPGGYLFIAIYNDMGAESVAWQRRKKRYCELPPPLRAPYAVLVMLPYEVKAFGRAVLSGRPMEYIHSWTRYQGRRGMSRWRDIVDWVGGYPYEVSSVERVVEFYAARGFTPARVERTGGLGCNEFVLRREPAGEVAGSSAARAGGSTLA